MMHPAVPGIILTPVCRVLSWPTAAEAQFTGIAAGPHSLSFRPVVLPDSAARTSENDGIVSVAEPMLLKAASFCWTPTQPATAEFRARARAQGQALHTPTLPKVEGVSSSAVKTSCLLTRQHSALTLERCWLY